MNVNTHNAQPVYDQVINVAKAAPFKGRIFKDEWAGLWFELRKDGFMLGASPWEAAEWYRDRPGARLVTEAQLQQAYPAGEFIPTP